MRRLAILVPLVVLAGLCFARGEDLQVAKPEQVGLSAEKLAAITPALQKQVDDGKIAGSVALVVRRGQVAYAAAVGYRDLAAKTPMTQDTIFAIASMTKPITCVAAMTLVEHGKLGLDDPVAKYVPGLREMRVLGDPKDKGGDEMATVPAKRPITVRDLFTHTSGFSYGAFMSNDKRLDRSYSQAKVMDRSDMKTVAEQVERLGKTALAHQPGERWTYGLSHDVLGRLIEIVSGKGLDRYLEEHVFTPLDMRDTSFQVPESKRDRVATIYRAEGGKLTPLPKHYGSGTFFSGGGGLFSTARDYARFAQMLCNGGELEGKRVLKAESVREMTKNQIGKLAALGVLKYGLGFGLEMGPGAEGAGPQLRRYFWGGLYSTNFWVDPSHELVGVVMTQVLPTNSAGTEQLFRRLVDGAMEK
jgi:CubicO group peptidase (beta-lactamase class C family)